MVIIMNVIKKRLKLRFAKVPNVNNPSFNDSDVLDIIRNAGFKKYVDDYKRVSAGTGDDQQGSKGFWTRQLAGVGVKHPIIFYNEVYSFTKSGEVKTFVVSWRYDTNDNLLNSEVCVTKFNDSAAKVIRNFSSIVQLFNGYNVTGEFSSYQMAKNSVEKDVEQYERNVNIE